MANISPICKKCKTFISALKSPTYNGLHYKKIIKIQDIKISHLGTFNKTRRNRRKAIGEFPTKDRNQALVMDLMHKTKL
jgi:hypothetical protein